MNYGCSCFHDLLNKYVVGSMLVIASVLSYYMVYHKIGGIEVYIHIVIFIVIQIYILVFYMVHRVRIHK